jgi:hypothetical protein
MGVGDKCHASVPLYLLERPGTHFVGCWRGLKAGLDKCGNSLLTGIQPRTFQPVTPRYTDGAIPAPTLLCLWLLHWTRKYKIGCGLGYFWKIKPHVFTTKYINEILPRGFSVTYLLMPTVKQWNQMQLNFYWKSLQRATVQQYMKGRVAYVKSMTYNNKFLQKILLWIKNFYLTLASSCVIIQFK